MLTNRKIFYTTFSLGWIVTKPKVKYISYFFFLFEKKISYTLEGMLTKGEIKKFLYPGTTVD